ncbi:NADPH-dependent FMN reductase [Colwellia sp. C1TZA3]|uniref:NADPH-dependent FMN reductase n=1 Tax=Colwellia sp. C1TZA3 TaxID=2508879 RepID=UPI0011B979CA|nr:NAD(P)H-dependent oxidoreductase [Colwellia sp. C1TZA3]TWX69252.1 NAD(P)H-dependent oxidoreductase [Colwellia sp. C1TZA3]
MKIIAFGASSSRQSINKQLATYAANLAAEIQANIDAEVLDLNAFELPLFSQDKEAELGQPEAAKIFFDKLGESDAIIISFAEHNGSYTAAYKNLFDWTSRINQKVFQSKPMLLLATSPGPGGASSVLAAATASAPYFAGEVKASLSVPNFFEHFDMKNNRLTNDELHQQLLNAIKLLIT